MRIIEREIVAAFIFSSDDCILLGQTAAGGVYPEYWLPPGGGVEDDESEDAALIREIAEETGLDISHTPREKIDIIHSDTQQKTLRGGERVLVTMNFTDFHVRLEQPANKIPIQTTSDLARATWFPRAALGELQLTRACQETLQKLGYLPFSAR